MKFVFYNQIDVKSFYINIFNWMEENTHKKKKKTYNVN